MEVLTLSSNVMLMEAFCSPSVNEEIFEVVSFIFIDLENQATLTSHSLSFPTHCGEWLLDLNEQQFSFYTIFFISFPNGRRQNCDMEI